MQLSHKGFVVFSWYLLFPITKFSVVALFQGLILKRRNYCWHILVACAQAIQTNVTRVKFMWVLKLPFLQAFMLWKAAWSNCYQGRKKERRETERERENCKCVAMFIAFLSYTKHIHYISFHSLPNIILWNFIYMNAYIVLTFAISMSY